VCETHACGPRLPMIFSFVASEFRGQRASEPDIFSWIRQHGGKLPNLRGSP